MNGKAAEQEDVTGTNGPFCRAGDSTRSTLRCPGSPEPSCSLPHHAPCLGGLIWGSPHVPRP